MLAGRFTMHPVVKAFMAVWLGFCAVWSAFVAAAFLGPRPAVGFLSLFGVLMGLAGFGLMMLGQALARNDEEWLSGVIRRALARDGY